MNALLFTFFVARRWRAAAGARTCRQCVFDEVWVFIQTRELLECFLGCGDCFFVEWLREIQLPTVEIRNCIVGMPFQSVRQVPQFVDFLATSLLLTSESIVLLANQFEFLGRLFRRNFCHLVSVCARTNQRDFILCYANTTTASPRVPCRRVATQC